MTRLLTLALAAALRAALTTAIVVGCAAPPPSQAPPSAVAAAETPTPAPKATATPPPTPVPTPAATLAIHGLEVFPSEGDATWELATTETNVDGTTRIAVLRAITDTVEVYAECVGTGTLTVSMSATPPIAATDAQQPAPTNTEMTSFELTCPDVQAVSFGGSAPAGWFVSTDAVPSDPSITYQVLVATAIP